MPKLKRAIAGLAGVPLLLATLSEAYLRIPEDGDQRFRAIVIAIPG